jgi:hypothetical protein
MLQTPATMQACGPKIAQNASLQLQHRTNTIQTANVQLRNAATTMQNEGSSSQVLQIALKTYPTKTQKQSIDQKNANNIPTLSYPFNDGMSFFGGYLNNGIMASFS